MPPTLQASLSQGAVLLLDGPTGTELERRGYRTSLPLWTAFAVWEATEVLRSIHEDYVRAGVDILTACTFRTTRHTLGKRGLGSEARPLTQEAVALARTCSRSSQRIVSVAGSLAPLEDCYKPELTPDNLTLEREHAAQADNLARAGVDLLLVESMPTLREALYALRAAIATGLPVIVSFLAGSDGTLLDGSALRTALQAIEAQPILVASVNCAPPDWCTQAVEVLSASGLPFGAYANSSTPDRSFGATPAPLDVARYTAIAASWLAQGAVLVGGCCGTRTAHISALRTLIDSQARRSA